MKAPSDVNFGQILENYIKQNKISKASLARAINRTDNAILYFQKKISIQSSIILELCNALKHNFFMDIAAQLPVEFTTNASIDTSKDLRIAALENEIALLKAREEVLLLAFKR